MVKTNYKGFVSIILALTIIVFSVGVYTSSVHSIVIYALEFYILLEIIRSMIEFLLNGNNRVKIRYLVDGVIAWFFKEIYVTSTHMQTLISHGDNYDVEKMLTLSAIVLFYTVLSWVFFIIRKKVILESPDNLKGTI